MSDSCLWPSTTNKVCGQGSVPAYSVHAQTADDVQKYVQFATKNNLKIVVKNTGHDYKGRSSGKGECHCERFHCSQTSIVTRSIEGGISSRRLSTVDSSSDVLPLSVFLSLSPFSISHLLSRWFRSLDSRPTRAHSQGVVRSKGLQHCSSRRHYDWCWSTMGRRL